MYLYEDRTRAVSPHIKLGKCIGVTILQLGYPTTNSLKSKHQEYEKVKWTRNLGQVFRWDWRRSAG